MKNEQVQEMRERLAKDAQDQFTIGNTEYFLETGVIHGYHYARLKRLAPKSRDGRKQCWGYRFRSEDERDTYVVNEIKNMKYNYEKRQERNAERKEKRKLEKAQKFKEIQVGDIFYDSWGYDQTNIDYWQVVSKKGAKVEIRELARELIREDWYETRYTKPLKDQFIGPAETRMITCHGISRNFGCLFKWDGEAKMSTHYA